MPGDGARSRTSCCCTTRTCLPTSQDRCTRSRIDSASPSQTRVGGNSWRPRPSIACASGPPNWYQEQAALLKDPAAFFRRGSSGAGPEVLTAGGDGRVRAPRDHPCPTGPHYVAAQALRRRDPPRTAIGSGRVRYRSFGNQMPAKPHWLTVGTPCAPRRLTAARYRCGHPDFPSPLYR